jgi:hypothetical protein
MGSPRTLGHVGIEKTSKHCGCSWSGPNRWIRSSCPPGVATICGSSISILATRLGLDIHRLAKTRTFDGDTMRLAVAATFARRGMDIPSELPLALTSEFGENTQKKTQ